MRFLIPGESLTYDDRQEHDEFGSTNRQGKLLRISGRINLDSKVSVGCVGAALTYLQRKRAAEFLQDDPDAQQAYRITRMEMFSISGTMYVCIFSFCNCTNVFAGSLAQIHYSPYRSSSLNLIRMLSIKVLAPLDQKSRSPSTDFSITWRTLLKGELDYDSCSCGLVSILKRSAPVLTSSLFSFGKRT